MSTGSEASFTVIVRGTTFILTKTAVEFDSPNYFTAAFLKHNFLEAQNKSVTLNQFNPIIFQVVVDYLNGDEILPLPEVLNGTKSKEVVINSLRKYADYLQLEGLSMLLPHQAEVPSFSQLLQVKLLQDGWHSEIIEHADLISGKHCLEYIHGRGGRLGLVGQKLPVIIHIGRISVQLNNNLKDREIFIIRMKDDPDC